MARFSKTLHRYARILNFSRRSGFQFFNHIWKAYTPDSVTKRGLHSEVFCLYEKFRKRNRGNNGGDIGRLFSWILNIKQVIEHEGIAGDFAELGVYRGNTAAILAHYAYEYSRECYLFDTFAGFDAKDLRGVDQASTAGMFSSTSVEIVRDVIGEPQIQTCNIIQGHFPDSLPKELSDKKFALVSLDCDLYEPTVAALKWFFRKMPDGALFMLHDYSSATWLGAQKAIDEFCVREGQNLILMPDKSGSAFIRVNHYNCQHVTSASND